MSKHDEEYWDGQSQYKSPYTADCLNDVSTERIAQNKKWGHQNHPFEKWMTILMEEVGELAEAVLDNNSDNIYAEATQTAAVAVEIMEQVKRNQNDAEKTEFIQKKYREIEKATLPPPYPGGLTPTPQWPFYAPYLKCPKCYIPMDQTSHYCCNRTDCPNRIVSLKD